MSSSRPPLFLVLLLAGLAGCTPPPVSVAPATHALRLEVFLPTAVPADVARVTVTVSGADMASLSTNLVLADGLWVGVLADIPPGTQRAFLARAYTASNTLRYEGRADNVTVTANTTGYVWMTLQDVSNPPPFTNAAPLIDSLVVTPALVAPGGTISLTATAHDPNAGDTLAYAWTAPSGSFSTPGQTSTTWTASAQQAPVTLRLTVSDPSGAATTVDFTVRVSAGTGAQEVKVDFNLAPALGGLSSTRSVLDVGESTALTVTATDADRDALGYQWSATCPGTFTGASTASATFTPSALPAQACNNCRLRVTVTDGRGGQNTGDLALCVAREPEWKTAPVIVRSLQSSPTATARQPLTFEVEARDPAGTALTFAWTASTGTLGTAASAATLSRITWTAPGCIYAGTTPSVTATVTNALGLKTSRVFTVPGVPDCPFSPTTSMTLARTGHRAVLLPNGKVLVMGGRNNFGTLLAAEVYDPATGTWSRTGDTLAQRMLPTATLLPNGKVLVTGGNNGSSSQTSTELYDPATGTWSFAGHMAAAHVWHTATLLPGGKVLVTGGYTAAADLYDPATGTWSPTGAMSRMRRSHTATLLPNGQVLIAGGTGGGSEDGTAELYDPATGTWSPTDRMRLLRNDHTATLLPNGRVLVAGDDLSAEEYFPDENRWRFTGSLSTLRKSPAATLLSTGKVLVTGGFDLSAYAQASAELYDPVTGTWSPAGAMITARHLHAETRLPSGKVLITGGYTRMNDPVATAELYDPAASP